MPPKKTRNGLIPVIGYRGISDAQLVGIRNKFTQNKVNKDFCRSSIIRAANDSYGEVAATIELDQAEGKSFTWHIANVYNMLTVLLHISKGFRFAMQAAMANSGRAF